MNTKASLKSHLSAALTLIELLFSITIIVTLLSLSLVLASRVSHTGRATKCTSNLRQIGAGLTAYITEHNGALIPAAVPTPEWYWFNELDPYMNPSGTAEIVPSWAQCPAKKFRTLTRETVGYGWNYMNFGWDLVRKNSWGYGSRLVQASHPATTIIIGDSKDLDINPTNAYHYENRYLYTPPEKPELLPKRHNGRGNYLFLDGHVEAIANDTLEANPSLYKKIKN